MGVPKALLRLRERTFLETILDTCAQIGLGPVVVVLGLDDDKILASLQLDRVIATRSRDLEAGPIGSIQAGIAQLNQPVDGAVVWHVDRPHVLPETVRLLVNAFRGGTAQIVLPTYDGSRGHPVLFSRAVFEELLKAPQAEGARSVVRADASRVLEVPVTDPAILEDVNTPEAYRALLKRLETR